MRQSLWELLHDFQSKLASIEDAKAKLDELEVDSKRTESVIVKTMKEKGLSFLISGDFVFRLLDGGLVVHEALSFDDLRSTYVDCPE